MKAVIGYYYPEDRWILLDVMLGPLSCGADTYKRCRTADSPFTEIVEAEVKGISLVDGMTNVEVGNFQLPPVKTLEMSIEECRRILRNYMGAK